ncbi:MAG: FecR family protein [Gallionella sp.]|nr:FecR family protein [Gallionella sp.]
MKNIRLSIISILFPLFLGSTVAHAEMIGRVLVAVGDTAALRNGVEVKLARGGEIQSGDTLRVGETSNMQVRFTDESIIALRSNSVFRIDDYKFESEKNLGKSFFSLVKGGMRSITGLIGRFNRDNYAVKATSATIGIRGTHFVLAQCDNDCFNKDGSKAENGLFGGVTDGRVAVNNQAGEKEFGKNEFFHVPTPDALPKPLLTPPSFLRDQLEGQAKSKEGKTTVVKAASQKEAKNGDKAATSEGKNGAETAGGTETVGTTTTAEQQASAAVTTQPADTVQAPDQIVVVTPFMPADQPVVQTNLGVAAGSYSYSHAMVGANAGISSGSSSHSFSEAWVEQGVLTILDTTKLAQKEDMFFAQLVTSQSPALTFLMSAFSVSATSDYYSSYDQLFNPIGSPVGTVSFSWAKTASTNTGSDALAGNLSWGRHTETDQGTFLTGPSAGNTFGDTRYEHWATGDLVDFAALPTSGTYSYAWIGGTNPTDQNGVVGTFTGTGSTVGVQFTGASGANITLTGATWTMPSGNNYSLSFANQPVNLAIATNYATTTAGWTDAGTRTYMTQITVSATCSGSCATGPVSTKVSGMLFGTTATGLAAGISTSIPGGEQTASVQAYKR